MTGKTVDEILKELEKPDGSHLEQDPEILARRQAWADMEIKAHDILLKIKRGLLPESSRLSMIEQVSQEYSSTVQEIDLRFSTKATPTKTT